jgi:hypothetical protein
MADATLLIAFSSAHSSKNGFGTQLPSGILSVSLPLQAAGLHC